MVEKFGLKPDWHGDRILHSVTQCYNCLNISFSKMFDGINNGDWAVVTDGIWITSLVLGSKYGAFPSRSLMNFVSVPYGPDPQSSFSSLIACCTSTEKNPMDGETRVSTGRAKKRRKRASDG